MYFNIESWLYYHKKPKRGVYKPARRKSFAQFGSWAHRAKTPRKGSYKPRHS